MKLSKFKVGDKVRVNDGFFDIIGEVGCIHKDCLYLVNKNILASGCTCYSHKTKWICREYKGHVMSSGNWGKPLQKITDDRIVIDGVKIMGRIIKSNDDYSSKNLMTNVIEFFKNMTATAEEKMLKEQGMEDPIGTPTEEGLKLSAFISYKANREKIIEIVKAKVEKEKEDKK